MKTEPYEQLGNGRVVYSVCISPLLGKICVNVEFDPWGDFFQVIFYLVLVKTNC